MIQELRINGITITDGQCKGHKVVIGLKDFPATVVCTPSAFFNEQYDKVDGSRAKSKSHETLLTESEIIRWFNECESFEVRDNVLTLYTEKYTLHVKVEE